MMIQARQQAGITSPYARGSVRGRTASSPTAGDFVGRKNGHRFVHQQRQNRPPTRAGREAVTSSEAARRAMLTIMPRAGPQKGAGREAPGLNCLRALRALAPKRSTPGSGRGRL